MPPLAVAQVDTVFPSEGAVSIVFPTLAMVSGMRVRVATPGASDDEGVFKLPQRGDWGLVAFYQNDPRSCVWLASLSDVRWNALPLEILTDDPEAKVTRTPAGAQTVEWGPAGAGDTEHTRADGTLLRVTHGKDGSTSNATRRATRTAWHLTKNAERQEHTPPELPPADLYLEHASGATVLLTADGSFELTTAKGHRLRMHDGTEKARSEDAPHDVTSTPEEDAQRASSEIELTTEKGMRVTLHDDPESGSDRHLTLSTSAGHRLTLRDGSGKGAELTTAAGLKVKLDDNSGAVTVHGQTVTVDGQAITLKGQTVTVDASLIKLGAGATRRVALDKDPVIANMIQATTTTILGQ